MPLKSICALSDPTSETAEEKEEDLCFPTVGKFPAANKQESSTVQEDQELFLPPTADKNSLPQQIKCKTFTLKMTREVIHIYIFKKRSYIATYIVDDVQCLGGWVQKWSVIMLLFALKVRHSSAEVANQAT